MKPIWIALMAAAVLAAGCVEHRGLSGAADAGSDAMAGADAHDGADQDGGTQDGADPGQVADGDPAPGDGGADCDAPISIETGEQGPCTPFWVPCGFQMTQRACDEDGTCPDGVPCWQGACLVPQPEALTSGPGCVEVAAVLRYGGASPDRVYEYLLEAPPFQRADGSAMVEPTGMWFTNPMNCEWFGPDECWTYEVPVVVAYGPPGLEVSGGSAFELVRLRADPADPVGPAWLAGAGPVEVAFGARFQFPGGEPLEWFQSRLWVDVFHPRVAEGCVDWTRYSFVLVPERESLVEASPEVSTHCAE